MINSGWFKNTNRRIFKLMSRIEETFKTCLIHREREISFYKIVLLNNRDNEIIFTYIYPDRIIKIFHNITSFCLGRGNSLYPNLPVQMGLYSPINLYGTKGRENRLLYGPFRPGKMLFPSPF
jgi:hypothetical protein